MDLTLGLLIFGWVFVAIWIPVVILSQRKLHPKALFTLFFAELWERFSFYGMRALLILYMTKVLFDQMSQGEADAKAYGIYGAYGALVYGMPVIGGLIADKLLGFRRAIIIGGILMAVGHFVLAMQDVTLFYIALSLIIIGNGFFKPNISSFLGTFYDPNDARKDGAFTIFYMGVNLGAFLAPLTCGYLGEVVGWHYGFGAAGIGMLIGLIVFWRSMRSYQDKGLPPDRESLFKPFFMGLNKNALVILGTLAFIPVCAMLLNINDIMAYLLLGLGVVIIGYLLFYALTADDKVEGQRLLVVVVLFFFHSIFWALFEQAGGSLTLFADRNVDRMLLGTEIPTSLFQSVNPMFIILLAPLFSWMWLKLSKAGKEPSTPMKFSLGLIQLGLGFGVVVLGAVFAKEGYVPLIFLMLMYLLHTTGELSLSPIGLSMVTKLSPAKIVGFVMGAWFLSISFAHELAGQLGKLTAVPEEGADATVTLSAFTEVYLIWGVFVVIGAGLLLLFLVPILRKWMHGIH